MADRGLTPCQCRSERLSHNLPTGKPRGRDDEAAGEVDPDAPAYGTLRAGNHTLSGFSIRKLARTAPERVRTLITDVLSLNAEGLLITPPTVIAWDQLIDADDRQSDGLALGKSVVAVS